MQENGAGKRTRTSDQLLTKQLLYQLSYSGKRCELYEPVDFFLDGSAARFYCSSGKGCELYEPIDLFLDGSAARFYCSSGLIASCWHALRAHRPARFRPKLAMQVCQLSYSGAAQIILKVDGVSKVGITSLICAVLSILNIMLASATRLPKTSR